jgi:hypothetical protein
MNTRAGGFVLDYHERLLIRRALQVMSTCSGVSREDVAILERLEQQFKDADEAVLRGLNLAHYVFQEAEK